jgi:hypothetical protein
MKFFNFKDQERNILNIKKSWKTIKRRKNKAWLVSKKEQQEQILEVFKEGY